MPRSSTRSKQPAANHEQEGSLVHQVAQGLRELLNDPRRLAQELIREQLGVTGSFLGNGTAERPWIVFGRTGGFYGFYVRGRELLQVVRCEPDRVVYVL